MKIEVHLSAPDVEIYPNDLAADFDDDATDDEIRRRIRDDVVDALAEREFPNVFIREADVTTALRAVRRAMKEQKQ